ncbi:hypothetical protein MGYG_00623 [Nannizzia gypsea CBS 118893]|uniref:Uncharacterized protein n=1 Tax=Arthroderma gypseum (strain ATCC MYA-4604 / CBS 118893) TaxID=535722 RepID=E5R0S7_ARTGP|nr:hypothetical protein MGYG_00623 [Nannizzia gypsea CBS 118893]EFQ97583.1 hypothetical protein MGYG_00623 [Nannizzia gypsea CBS 118893]
MLGYLHFSYDSHTLPKSEAINLKRIKLHPIPAPNDRSIGVYYSQVTAEDPSSKIYISAPYEPIPNSSRRAEHEEEQRERQRDKQIAD